jgi:hypothetical protein
MPKPNSRKGVTLAITLMMLVIVTMLATTLYNMTNTNMMIAGNMRRHTLSKQAAMSGIHHFEGLGLHHSDIAERLGNENEAVVIPMTPLGNTWYEVRVVHSPGENKFMVISEGLMKDGDRIIAAATMSATYETIYREAD